MTNAVNFPLPSGPANDDSVGELRFSLHVHDDGFFIQPTCDGFADPRAVLVDLFDVVRTVASQARGGDECLSVIAVMANGGGLAWTDDRIHTPEDIDWLTESVALIVGGAEDGEDGAPQ